MSRFALLIPLFALACDQPAPPAAPPPTPEAATPPPGPEAPPEAAPAPAAFAFEGEHAMAMQDAAKAADAWLNLADAANGAATWDAAAGYFQDAVSKDTWTQQLTAVRSPLGAVQSRRLQGATYQTSLPGAPDGEYVVLQYETSFENKAEGFETVTPMLDWDGTWKVSGYFVR
ncbi:MAG: DUF4019 domain-containing protein [Pseudomonadota bacterium]